MGTPLELNAIRDYLIEVGCKIEYPILVNAFKQHLYNPDSQVQGRVRTLFKDYVNRLATVSLENNMKFIILRPEFRPSSYDQPDTSVISSKQSSPQQTQTQRQPQQLLPPLQPQHRVQAQLPSVSDQQQQSLIKTRDGEIIKTRRQDMQLAMQDQQPAPRAPLHQPHYQQQHRPPPLIKLPSRPPPQPMQQVQSPKQLSPRESKPLQLIQSSQPSSPKSISYYQPIQQNPKQQHQFHHPLQQSMSYQDQSELQQMRYETPPAHVATRSQSSQRPESLNLGSSQMPPPRPPPRRRLSTASLFKSSPKPIEKSREINDLAKKSLGKVKEHALKLNSSASSSDLNALSPLRNTSMKENRLSRDYGGSLGSALHRSGSHVTTRSRSSHREDESDSSSLQPIDALKRKWIVEACNCNYNGLLTLLREDPKLATYREMANGYTALHWAAKFGNLDVIKLMAGTHGVSPNIKSSAGYTPLHLACMFQRTEAVDLLIKSYKASFSIRDHSGKKPMQYWQKPLCLS